MWRIEVNHQQLAQTSQCRLLKKAGLYRVYVTVTQVKRILFSLNLYSDVAGLYNWSAKQYIPILKTAGGTICTIKGYPLGIP